MFCGAFNDNVFKNALLVYVMFSFTEIFNMDVAIVVSLAAGLFILPFMLFSGLAGQLADSQDKARLTGRIKAIEIGLCAAMVIGFVTQSVGFLLLVLFLMGAQSTFFGPIKYSILPDYLNEDELLKANSYMAGGTFIAILLGTIYGGFCILLPNGLLWVGGILGAAACIGWGASRFMPSTTVSTKLLDLSLFKSSVLILKHVWQHPVLWKLCLGISWFWFLGATFLSQFPAFIKSINAAPEWVSVFMALFSIGIAMGAGVCNMLLKGAISPRLLSLSSIGLSAATLHLVFVTYILQSSLYWVMIDVLIIAMFGGMFSVPLYAMLQRESKPSHGAQNIAANNILNAIFMVGSAIYAAVLFATGLGVAHVFAGVAICSIPLGVMWQRQLEKALKLK